MPKSVYKCVLNLVVLSLYVHHYVSESPREFFPLLITPSSLTMTVLDLFYGQSVEQIQ